MLSEFENLLDQLNALAERHHALVLQNIELNQALREEESTRITTLSTLAHELRRPFSVIRLLLEQVTKKEQTQHATTCRTINEEIDRAGELLDDIITLNKLELKKISPPKSFSLSKLCEQIFEHQRLRSPKHRWHAEITPEIHLTAAMENVIVILENLLENAVKYTPPDKAITLRLMRKKNSPQLEVEDEGSGITSYERKKILLPFYRGKTMRSSTSGSGLGLAIVTQAVRNLDSTLQVRRGKKGGSIFTVCLTDRNNVERSET